MLESNKKLPLVSVIVNCHNGEKYLEQAIKSVLNQSYKKWEVIFFDNKSTDKSSFILKKFKSSKIKYFKSKKKHHLYKARNLALEKCKGEYISFLDTDDWWDKNKIKEQVKFFLKNKNEDVVFSNLYIFKEKSSKFNVFIKKNFLNTITTQSLVNNFQMPILTTMIKKNVFKRIKFNNKYTIIGDFDFFIRLSRLKRINYMHKPLAFYRHHDSNLTNKRIDLNIKELNHWLEFILKKKYFKNTSFKSTKNLVEILEIKRNLLINKKLKALKLILKKPITLSKLKYLLFFFR